MTSPAPGASSAADLPDYAPIPPSAVGPALNDHRYYVGRVERNLYWFPPAANVEVFTTTTFTSLQSTRLDLGPSSPLHP